VSKASKSFSEWYVFERTRSTSDDRLTNFQSEQRASVKKGRPFGHLHHPAAFDHMLCELQSLVLIWSSAFTGSVARGSATCQASCLTHVALPTSINIRSDDPGLTVNTGPFSEVERKSPVRISVKTPQFPI
jgi:hypothetical protein